MTAVNQGRDSADTLPPALFAGIAQVMLRDAELGWAKIDLTTEQVIAEHNGRRFGLAGSDHRSLDDFPFLLGNLPTPGETIMIPMLQLCDGAPADVFAYQDQAILWVLFVGRDAEHAAQSTHQQRLNEAALSGRRYERLLDRFVGGELVKHRLLEAPLPTSMEPSTRRLTMLFADIRGFTPYCEARDAAQACQLLNQYLQLMVEAVTANGGIIDKIIGDAVMGLFGLTDNAEHAAARAIAAARDMLETSADLCDLTATSDLSVAGVGVGIASGQVAVGVLGTANRRSFTVIGHRVNLAARLESSAEAGEILIDSESFASAGEQGRGFKAQTRRLKGLTEPVSVYSYR